MEKRVSRTTDDAQKRPVPKHKQYGYYTLNPESTFPWRNIDRQLIFQLKDTSMWDFNCQKWRYTAKRDCTFLEDQLVSVKDVAKQRAAFDEYNRKKAAKRKQEAENADIESRQKAKQYKTLREKESSALKSAKTQNALLNKKLKNALSQNFLLKSKIGRHAAIVSENKEYKKRIDVLVKQLNRKKEEVKALKADLNEAASSSSSSSSDISSDEEVITAKVLELEAAKTTAMATIQTLQTQNKTLETQNKTLEKENKLLQKDNKNLRMSHREAKATLTSQKKELSSQKKELSALAKYRKIADANTAKIEIARIQADSRLQIAQLNQGDAFRTGLQSHDKGAFYGQTKLEKLEER